jgi:hypothetical protein
VTAQSLIVFPHLAKGTGLLQRCPADCSSSIISCQFGTNNLPDKVWIKAVIPVEAEAMEIGNACFDEVMRNA